MTVISHSLPKHLAGSEVVNPRASEVRSVRPVCPATCAVTVADVPIALSSSLNQAGDTGLSNTDCITNDNTPTFSGRSEPGSVVTLIAMPQGGGPAIALGQTVADAGGA